MIQALELRNMPFSPTAFDFYDGPDKASSTELGVVTPLSDGLSVEITGLGSTAGAVFVGAKLRARIAEVLALVATDPNRGIPGLDVENDPTLAVDPRTIAYTEPTTAPAPAFYTLKSASVAKVMSRATLDGLDGALAALGF